MTHHADAERAEFEAWAQSQWRGINLAWMIDFSKYADFGTNTKWLTWQAARRDPAVPVPQFSRIAQKKLDYLLEAGEAITGYAIENKDGRRGAIDCHGFVYWWQDAAAPQPPACNPSMQPELATYSAPVQLPEPAAWVFKDRTWTEIRAMAVDHGGVPAYTEQQVRQLLAAHGIKEQST